MALNLKKLVKPGLSTKAARYSVKLKTGKSYLYRTHREIREDLKPSEIEAIHDRHTRRAVDPATLGRRKRKQ